MKKNILAVAVVVGLVSGVAFGAPIVGRIHDGETDGFLPEWTNEAVFAASPYASLTDTYDFGGSHNDALLITGGGAIPTPNADEIFESSDLIGDLSATGIDARLVHFDFYSGGGTAQSVSLFIRDTGTGYTFYAHLGSLGSGWTQRDINLNYYLGGWSPGTGTPATSFAFDSVLATVDAIGIELEYRAMEAGQVYGLDNFWLDDEYLTPEPGTIAMLLSVFASLGVVIRRRIKE